MPPEPEDKKPDDAGGKKPDPPSDPKPEVSFKTKAEFHAEIERKTKSAVRAAVDEHNKKLFETLGIESEEEIPNIVEGVKKAKAAVTEEVKLKGDFAKLQKKHDAEKERADGLSKWRETAIKSKAISAFQAKTVDLETLTLLVDAKIVIGEDDSVTGPNGKPLEDVVEEILKAKPFLKAPDHVGGAGTKPGGEKKPEGDKKLESKDDGDKKLNGRPLSVGQVLAAQLKENASAGGGGGGGP